MKKILLLFVLIYITSCTYKNTKEDIEKHKNTLKKDNFLFEGTYSWSFELMGSTQISTNTFFTDSIIYQMKGKVHSTDYSIRKLSYNASQNKWIGETPDKVVYVLFFKDKTDRTITIYKHKCKTNGLEEAIQFEFPNDDATDDHGWNIYALNGYQTKDVLPLSGTYKNVKDSISITDEIFIYNNEPIEKMSYHSGERRWVGKYNDHYLLVFFKDIKNEDSLQLSIHWYDDLETLYKTKYSSVSSENWNKFEKY